MTKKKAARPKKKKAKAASNALNPKQQQFVNEYVVDHNAKQAAIRAGYSPRSAEVTGSRLLSNDKVAAQIKRMQAKAAERAIVTVQDIADQLDDDRKFARENKSSSAAVQATMGKAKVLGLIIDKHVVGMKRIEDMNENELRAVLGAIEEQ